MILFSSLILCLAAIPVSLATILKLSGPASLPQTASSPLNPALASFSIETAFLIEYIGNTTAPNTLTRNLLDNLVARAGTPAQVRIGGITADSTYWDADLDVALLNGVDASGALQNTTIGPAFWEAVRTLLPKGTKVIVTLDLQDLNYTGALSVAQSALDGLDPGQITAFEIGNEPDHYLSFTPQTYTAIWEPWAKNITTSLQLPLPDFQIAATAEDPLWPYNTPRASSQLDCVSALAAGANVDGVVKTCSEHTYQYSVCDPTRAAVATLPNLVNHTRLAQYLDLWQPRIDSVRTQLGPDSFVIGEYNSVSCSGKDGVSNTFGQALWLLDTTLYAASINVSRLYIHQGGPLALQSAVQLNHGGLSFYNLWYPIQNQNGDIQVFPSYSAYLFVAEAVSPSLPVSPPSLSPLSPPSLSPLPTSHSHSTHNRDTNTRFPGLRIANIYPGRQPNGSTITTAGGDTSMGQLVVYGFWDDTNTEFPSRLALLNLQIYNSTQGQGSGVERPVVSFDISAFIPPPPSPHDTSVAPRKVRIRRLQAPGAEITSGSQTTWAGQVFSAETMGVASGEFVEETVVGGVVDVEASGAALVFLK